MKATAQPDNSHRFPAGWNIQLEDTTLPSTEADNPENYIVKKETGLANPATVNEQAAQNDATLHYLRYQIAEAREGAGAQLGDGSFPKAVKAPQRTWELNNAFGTIVVESTKVTHLWVPAGKDLSAPPADPGDRTHYVCYQVKPVKGVAAGQSPGACDSSSPANAKGTCEKEMDCGGTAGVTELCRKPKLSKKLQAFAADQFDDCATYAVSANVPFSGTGVEAKCLLDLKKPKELCNPVDKSAAGAGRKTAATISGSTPSTTNSLLCYQSKAASKIGNSTTASLANQNAGASLPQKQSKHARRVAVHTKPGNQFPAPVRVDTSKQELLCVPTEVLAVSAAP